MRWKIILPNLVIVLAIGLASWLYLNAHYTTYFDEQASQGLARDRGLFVAVNQMTAVKFLRTVVARSRTLKVRDVFSPATPAEVERFREEQGIEGGEDAEASREELHLILRSRAHQECDAFRAYLRQEQAGGRTPEIVAITDINGYVLSRDVDPNAEPVGQNLGETYQSIGRARDGNAIRDIWYWNDFLLDVALAPIEREGEIRGFLLVGYDISNGVAQSDREMFGADVAYVFKQGNDWRVHSSSIAAGPRRDGLVAGVGQLQSALNESMANAQNTNYMDIEVQGEAHNVLSGPLSGENSSVQAGYLMLKSVRDVREPAKPSILPLFFALGGVLLVVAVGFFLAWHFLKPVEEIEEGVLRIINGDLEHRFEVKSTEFGGLAYRVNQLVSELTGEEEEPENGGSGGMS